MPLTPLHTGWTVRSLSGPVPADVADRSFAAEVPGCVHTDLLAAGAIPDPFDGDNESLLLWIGRSEWEYALDFEWQPDGEQRHDLVCGGLDTVASIRLNDVAIGDTQNQHRSYRFEVGDVLTPGTNRLRIRFAAPVDAAERMAKELGERTHVNHHPYNAIRKAASNFGWDWGIDAATVGIWRAIGIDSWSGARISAVRPLVGVEGGAGLLTTQIELERTSALPVALTVEVAGLSHKVTVGGDDSAVTVRIEVPEVELWWPRGHGAQPLYDVAVTIDGTGQRWNGRVGFRAIEIDTSADAAGATFGFVVNGEPIFIRGANWIPDDAFITRVDRERYAARIADATEANINLLRVWGGGIYESDDFYDLCDENGILVWQDFLFACAAYAEEEPLAGEIEAEAREAITRLSAHPSLALWNGNNECIWLYIDSHWRPSLGDATWGNGYYRELLPRLVAELDGTRPYTPGSPYSITDYLHPNDENNGTMHIWDVWNRKDYTAYREYRPRFVAEFGFQGPPAWSTLTAVVHDEPLQPFGAQMLVHQKANHGNRKLEAGLDGHFPTPGTIEDWHWATQLNQAHAIRYGIEYFRSLAPHNTGMIVWQLNDNWPVVSWAAVDYAGQRKPLWFALRDAFAPRLATIQPNGDGLDLVLQNDTGDEVTTSARVRRVGFDGSVNAEARLPISVQARGVSRVTLPPALARAGHPQTEVMVVDFDESFARATHDFVEVVDQWLDPEPITVTAEPGAVVVTASSYVRDVSLLVDIADVAARVDSGLVSLLPGETHRFEVTSQLDAAAFVEAVRSANDLVRSAHTIG